MYYNKNGVVRKVAGAIPYFQDVAQVIARPKDSSDDEIENEEYAKQSTKTECSEVVHIPFNSIDVNQPPAAPQSRGDQSTDSSYNENVVQ